MNKEDAIRQERFKDILDRGLEVSFSFLGIVFDQDTKEKLQFFQQKLDIEGTPIMQIKIEYETQPICIFSWIDKEYETTIFEWPLIRGKRK